MLGKTRSESLTDRLLRLSGEQHGLVSRRQLLDSGVSRGAIDGRREAHQLLPVCFGVYAVGRPITSDEEVWTASILGGGPGSFLARRSAAVLWGLVRGPDRPVELVRDDSRSPTRFRLGPPGISRAATVRVARSERLGEDEIDTRRGLPVTSINRTLLDLASVMSEKRLRSAFNEADRLGLLDKDRLVQYSEASFGQVGIGSFRRLVDVRHPETVATRSELESMFLDICRGAGLPTPRVNQMVCGFEVDCLWPDQRVVIELDGFEFHRGRMSFDRDANRDFVLKQAGYRVTRLTHTLVKNDPKGLADLVRRELGGLPGRSDRK